MEDLAEMSERGVSAVLLFLDPDHLKMINDRHGHATGDEALRLIGRILSRYKGQSDVAGRLGGEEFGLFQSGLTIEDMHTRCEEIRAEIAAVVLHAASGSRVQISIGNQDETVATIWMRFLGRGRAQVIMLIAADQFFVVF